MLEDEPALSLQSAFDPPSAFAVAVIGRSKLLICGFAIAFALIGAGYQLSRPSTYTASATLQVGQVNPNSPGFFGYIQSSSALATAFSRSISAEPVLAEVQKKLKITPAKADRKLSAEPIPLSPVFRVIAEGPTESSAIQLANVTAGATIAYVSKTNNANPEAASLLREYNTASLNLERAAAKLAEFEASTRSQTRGSHEVVHTSAFAADRAARDTAQAKLKAISAAYTAAVASQAPRSGLVSLVAGATSASNEHSAKVELFGFIGLLLGLVVGCVVAVWWATRRGNRLGFKAETQGPERV
jgi:uncharacterized protein involved in exopolysaccharide biosynthesis